MSFKKQYKILVFLILLFVDETHRLRAQPSQEVRKVALFENIVLEGSANTFVYINQDKMPSVKVKADQRYLSKIKTTVSDGTLTILLDLKNTGSAKIEIYVSLPVVKKVSISGGGNIELIEGVDKTVFQTSINGGGTMLISDKTTVQAFQSQITGGGSIDALKLNVRNAQINVEGGGAVLVQVEDRLLGNINGGGDILYKGDPEVISNVSGGGRIARR